MCESALSDAPASRLQNRIGVRRYSTHSPPETSLAHEFMRTKLLTPLLPADSKSRLSFRNPAQCCSKIFMRPFATYFSRRARENKTRNRKERFHHSDSNCLGLTANRRTTFRRSNFSSSLAVERQNATRKQQKKTQ